MNESNRIKSIVPVVLGFLDVAPGSKIFDPAHRHGPHRRPGRALHFFQDADVEGKDVVGLVDDVPLLLLGEIEGVQLGVPVGDKVPDRVHALELVKGHPAAVAGEVHRSGGHAPHHLPPEQVSQVPRVLVGNEQVPPRFVVVVVVAGNFQDPVHVLFGGRRGRGHGGLPVGSVEIFHVLFQPGQAAQPWLVDPSDRAVFGGVVEDALFHGGVDVVQAGDQVAVGIGAADSLEESLDEGRVFRHGMGFSRPVVQGKGQSGETGVSGFFGWFGCCRCLLLLLLLGTSKGNATVNVLFDPGCGRCESILVGIGMDERRAGRHDHKGLCSGNGRSGQS
mmetsp:Transcript_1846/g.4038  ORF Transcript_1846/g.4038 Transcript_1846/m.4038 type:complete len:334 (+) Transcript_1846:226-1227(+)